MEGFDENGTPYLTLLSVILGDSFYQIHQSDVTNRTGYAKIKDVYRQAMQNGIDYHTLGLTLAVLYRPTTGDKIL